jgi:hypothetical protein
MRRRAHPGEGSRRRPIRADRSAEYGVGLVGAVASRANRDTDIANLRQIALAQGTPPGAVESTRRTIESLVGQLSSLETQITEAKAALWGTSVEDESDG